MPQNDRRVSLNQKGAALTVAIITIVLLGFLATAVTQFTYNQRKLSSASSGQRIRLYYLAQAGVIDASSRIRTNHVVGLPDGGTAPFNFTNDGYDPGEYELDVDGDGTNDTTVNIGPADGTKKRPILSTGT